MSANERDLQPVELTLPEYIETFGDKLGVPKSLRDAIFTNETNTQHTKNGKIQVSPKGARGVGQLMPGTAKMLGVKNIDDPIENAHGALRLQKQLYDKYLRTQGDEHEAALLAAAAYNAGEGAIDKHNGIPPYKETQDYVWKVAQHLKKHPIKAPQTALPAPAALHHAPAVAPPVKRTTKAPILPEPGFRGDFGTKTPSVLPKVTVPTERTDEFAPAGPEIYAAQQKPSQIDSVLMAAVQHMQEKNAETKRKAALQGKVEQVRARMAGEKLRKPPGLFGTSGADTETVRKAISSMPFESRGPFKRVSPEQQAIIRQAVDTPQQPSMPAMQARRPGIIERAKEAIAPYTPGLQSIDTPGGIKTDLLRGVASGLTLGAVGGRREITPEERILDPNAGKPLITTPDLPFVGSLEGDAYDLGSTAAMAAPFLAASKALSVVPGLNRATRASQAARVGASFGGVTAAREGINAAKTGEPINAEEVAFNTATGAITGAIPGLSPTLKKRIVAAVLPQLTADIARGKTPKEAALNAFTNVGFESLGGRKLGVSKERFAEIRAQIEAGRTVPAETQRSLRNAEQVKSEASQPAASDSAMAPKVPPITEEIPAFVEEARRRKAEREKVSAGEPVEVPVTPTDVLPVEAAQPASAKTTASLPVERRSPQRKPDAEWLELTPEEQARTRASLEMEMGPPTRENGVPIQPEAPTVLREVGGDKGGIIAPSPTEPNGWRLTRFDSQGFSGHGEYKTREEALRDAQRTYRYTEPMSEKEFTDVASTEKFAAGNELTGFVQKSWQEITPADQQRINELHDIISPKAATPPKPIETAKTSGETSELATFSQELVGELKARIEYHRQTMKRARYGGLKYQESAKALKDLEKRLGKAEKEGQPAGREVIQSKVPERQKQGGLPDELKQSSKLKIETIKAETPALSKGEGAGKLAPKPANVIRTAAGHRSDRSLSQFVRKQGGIVPGTMFRGELDRLRAKETGTTGLINQHNRTGDIKMTADMMMEGANEAGFGPFENVGDFLYAVERDVAGEKQYVLTGEEVDYDTEVAKYYADQQTAFDAETARTELLEGGRGAELFDRIAEGKANDAERTELFKLAKDRGVNEAELEALIDGAREEIAELEASRGQRPSTARAEQLGFVQEGLTQESAPPPKLPDQRERLTQDESARQLTAVKNVIPMEGLAERLQTLTQSAEPTVRKAAKEIWERARVGGGAKTGEVSDTGKVQMLEKYAALKAKGQTVEDYASQGSLLGETPSSRSIAYMRELEGESAQPSFVASAQKRQAERAAQKAEGVEFRRAGADPYELVDNIIVRGWEIYSEKVRPTFEEWSKKIREEFGPESDSHLQKVWLQLGGERETSTAAKREKVTEDRAARGEEPIARPERKADEQLLVDAKAANRADQSEPMRLADQVLNGKKGALSDKETVQLDLHVQELKNKYDEVNREIGKTADPATIRELAERSDAMEREMRLAEEAWAASGTEKGRALRAQRIEIDQDYRLLTMVSKATKAHGRELTTKERTKIKEQSEKIADLERQLAEANDRAVAAEAAKSAGKIKADVAREGRRAGRRLRKQSLDDEAAELRQLIAQAWKKQSAGGGEIHSAMGLAKLDPEGVVTKLVVQLARNRVEANIGLKAESLVDEVHGLLKDVVDLSRRDVSEMISGYGKTFEMSQDAVDVRLRELKSIIASNLGKADVIEKGIRPLRRGMQRDKPTQEVRAAMRDLRDTLREHGMQVERTKGSPEEQQKSALDAAKTRTRNRIEDLNKWISDGKRTVANKTEIIPDPELKTLQGERDRLQKIFEAIDDPAADQKKIENALTAAIKSVGALQSKIRSGDIAAKARGGGLTSPELEAARAEQKALRSIITDLRTAAKPKPSDVEAEAKRLLSANKALGHRMEKQIAELERRMAQGDFSKTAKAPPVAITRENLDLQKRLNEIKHEYNKANYKATRSRFGQISDELAKAANVPKTLKSMGDISAVFRQGGFYALSHPIEGLAKPTAAMLRAFTETGYANVEQAIQNHPKFEQAKKDGVEFTGVDKNDPHLSRREEGYFGGETIDVLASGKANPLRLLKGVKNFSERTFVSFLDSQRMHMYDLMTEGLADPGIIARTMGQKPVNRVTSPEDFKRIAKLINIGTGRGNLGKAGNQAAPFLNILMFSPRLVVSRVQMLNNMFNPVTMARMPAGARNQMIADNVKFLAATAVAMNLAVAAGGTVNWDPDDADFLKIRFGKTTYDTLTGLQQPMRYIISMARAGWYGEKNPGQDMDDLTTRFARSKASPLMGLVTDAVTGEDFRGRKFEVGRGVAETVTPLPYKDFSEAMEKEGLIKGFLKATPALTGIGVQTYDERPDKPITHAEKLARKLARPSDDDPRTQEEINLARKRADLRARARKGEDVKAELDKTEATSRQRKSILRSKGKPRLLEDFNGLTLEEAVTVYETMDADEKASTRKILVRKRNDLLKDMPKEKQEKTRGRLRALGLMPPVNKESIQRYFPKSQ